MATIPLISRIRPEKDQGEAQQIEICRVICIFLMMYVHVPPGIGGEASGIAPFGLFLGDVLSRASVAALSFISGYLLWTYNRDKAFPALIVSKLRTLILPMATWGAIYLLIKMQGDSYNHSTLNDPFGVLNDLLGVTHRTANPSLFFIRDLFVSLLLIRLIWAFLRGPVGFMVLTAVVLMDLFGSTAPLVFRTNILSFAVAGAVWAANGLRLSDAARPAIAIPVVVVAGAGAWALAEAGLSGQAFGASENSLKRLSLTFAVIFAAHLLASVPIGQRVAAVGKHMFLTYLAHMSLFTVFWFAWLRIIGGPMDPSYALFFFACPAVAMGLGILLGQLADHLPVWVQTGLRGKVQRGAIDLKADKPLA